MERADQMVFLNVDDNFPEHPKIETLSDAAFRLHVSGLCYCARHLTDGEISSQKVTRLVPRFKRGVLDELVDAGVWHFDELSDTYRIHDFLDWNRSREEVVARRARRSKAGRKAANSRWHADQEELWDDDS